MCRPILANNPLLMGMTCWPILANYPFTIIEGNDVSTNPSELSFTDGNDMLTHTSELYPFSSWMGKLCSPILANRQFSSWMGMACRPS
jgi:hypothetical protein